MVTPVANYFSPIRRFSTDSFPFGWITRRDSEIPSLSSATTTETSTPNILTPRSTLSYPRRTGPDDKALADIPAESWTERIWQSPRRAQFSWTSFSSTPRDPTVETSPIVDEPAELAETPEDDSVAIASESVDSVSAPWIPVTQSVPSTTPRVRTDVRGSIMNVAKRLNTYRARRQMRRDRASIYNEERKLELQHRWREARPERYGKQAAAQQQKDANARVEKSRKNWCFLAWFLNYPEIADFYQDEPPPRQLGLPRLGDFFDGPVTPHPIDQLGLRR